MARFGKDYIEFEFLRVHDINGDTQTLKMEKPTKQFVATKAKGGLCTFKSLEELHSAVVERAKSTRDFISGSMTA